MDEKLIDVAEAIRVAYLEIASQLECLASGRYRRGFESYDWTKVAKQFAAVEHARHCYMEGEYQFALDALPEF